MKEYIVRYENEYFMLSRPDKMQELVRCKDCALWDIGHTEECDNSDSVCFHNGWCKPDFYCADGERKSADEKLMEDNNG